MANHAQEPDREEPVDPEVARRNEELKAWTNPPKPINKIPWSPFQVGLVVTIIFVVVLLLGILVLRRL